MPLKIGVVGLGKLGLPLASLLSRHHDVWGYDTNHLLMKSLSDHVFTTWEPNCDYSKVKLAHNQGDLVYNADLVFLCIPTPSDPDGKMDLSFARSAAKSLADASREVRASKLSVVMASTVMPGTCRDLNANHPELIVLSNPVWIALGSVVKDLQSPPAMVIGCNCVLDGQGFKPDCPHETLRQLWFNVISKEHKFIGKFPHLILTDTRTAEFLKLAHNAWCCIKMSWLGNLGDHARELDFDVKALSDFMANGGERPGRFWKYGPSFGGSCFPRDLGFWIQASEVDEIAMTSRTINNERLAEVAWRIPNGSRVLILGRSYKHGVPVTKGSIGEKLAGLLFKVRGCDVVVSDSWQSFGKDVVVVCQEELLPEIPSDNKVRVVNLWEIPS